jgi:excisionase family DNA binding protein
MEQTWESLATEVARHQYGLLAVSIQRELRNDLHVVAFYKAPGGVLTAPPLPYEVLILGWGPYPGDAYRKAIVKMASGDRALTTPEVAGLLGVTRNTVRDHARRGRLPFLIRGDANRPSHFAPEDVWALLVKLNKFAREDGEGVGLR